jgi:hypothetical protein
MQETITLFYPTAQEDTADGVLWVERRLEPAGTNAHGGPVLRERYAVVGGESFVSEVPFGEEECAAVESCPGLLDGLLQRHTEDGSLRAYDRSWDR